MCLLLELETCWPGVDGPANPARERRAWEKEKGKKKGALVLWHGGILFMAHVRIGSNQENTDRSMT